MTNAPDYPDYTTQVSRFMAQLAQSPATSSTAGWHSQVFDLMTWARSINLLVSAAANVISLTVTGVTTGFVYLNAIPIYDGGIYYIPAMPVIDTQITLRWYQVTVSSVSIYAVASDEPISVSVFNPISPTLNVTEKLETNAPVSCGANSLTTLIMLTDLTTNALRCTVDNPENYLWGKVTGDQSGTVYYDGSATNSKFPTTPIPVDHTLDSSISITVQTTVANSCNLYVAAINSPDFAGSIPLTQAMTAHDIAPSSRQNELPNQLPVIFDGAIAANGNTSILGAGITRQIRLHYVTITQYTSVIVAIELQDSNGVPYWRYHYSAAANSMAVPLFGMLLDKGVGLRIHNTTAVLSGAFALTVFYSVL